MAAEAFCIGYFPYSPIGIHLLAHMSQVPASLAVRSACIGISVIVMKSAPTEEPCVALQWSGGTCYPTGPITRST